MSARTFQAGVESELRPRVGQIGKRLTHAGVALLIIERSYAKAVASQESGIRIYPIAAIRYLEAPFPIYPPFETSHTPNFIDRFASLLHRFGNRELGPRKGSGAYPRQEGELFSARQPIKPGVGRPCSYVRCGLTVIARFVLFP